MQLVVNIVVLASIYALIACGYVLIYRVSRVLNLAHGELMMLGSYLLMTTASIFVGHPTLAIVAAIVLSLLVGVLVYVFLMRKMTGEMVLAAVLTTVALGILLRGIMVLFWSAQQQYPAQALGFSNPALLCPAAPGSRCSRHPRLHDRSRLRGLFFIPAVRALGRAHARRRAKPAAGGAARHQPARRLCAGLGPLDVHRLARRHADLARFRPHAAMVIIGLKAFPAALVGGLDSLVGAIVGALIIGAAEVL